MKGVHRDPERTEVRLLNRHALLAGARVLEIGCGDGRLTRRIATVVGYVVGIDPAAALIDRANKLTPPRLKGKVSFRVGTGAALRVPRASFDVAILSWSF